MRRLGSALSCLCVLIGAVACSDTGTENGVESTSTTATVASTVTVDAAQAVDPVTDGVIVSFPDPSSVDEWRNVDDSVMGGVSASTSTWVDDGPGALEFSGELSTENNGGFASTLSPVDRSLGVRAAGASAFDVHAVGDGRTYLLQLRAGPSGTDRWISRFTPPISDSVDRDAAVVLPLDSFEPVNQFLRRVDPAAPLDPATISQIGVYVLDGQTGGFRLLIEAITAVR